jgi:hypothetical protein
VPLDDLPDWLPAWCLDHLGSEPAGVLFQVQQVSMVFGLRLAGGTDVVVKARADDGRAVSRLMAELADVTVAPPLPNPPWVRWDHTDPGVWPSMWAASLWMAAYNARELALHGDTPVPGDALRAQAAERLRRANA